MPAISMSFHRADKVACKHRPAAKFGKTFLKLCLSLNLQVQLMGRSGVLGIAAVADVAVICPKVWRRPDGAMVASAGWLTSP